MGLRHVAPNHGESRRGLLLLSFFFQVEDSWHSLLLTMFINRIQRSLQKHTKNWSFQPSALDSETAASLSGRLEPGWCPFKIYFPQNQNSKTAQIAGFGLHQRQLLHKLSFTMIRYTNKFVLGKFRKCWHWERRFGEIYSRLKPPHQPFITAYKDHTLSYIPCDPQCCLIVREHSYLWPLWNTEKYWVTILYTWN